MLRTLFWCSFMLGLGVRSMAYYSGHHDAFDLVMGCVAFTVLGLWLSRFFD